MKRPVFLITALLILAEFAIAQAPSAKNIIITKNDIEKAGTSIPVSLIGEPIGSVRLNTPVWVEATDATPAHAVIEGSIFSVDPNGWPINFRAHLPASWSRRALQSGGGGMNGSITVRTGRNPLINRGFVNYGSDSGHQGGMGGGGNALASGPAGAKPDDWALNDEAIRNLGYMQMKKTHDAVMVIIERIYGERPLFNYYVGGSQGGREGLMVAQRSSCGNDHDLATLVKACKPNRRYFQTSEKKG
jgi:feruloyl esterase